jgi:ATP-dependent Clp protease ATP-binding subunit ClpC
MSIDSEELKQVAAEAEELARNASHRLSTTHLLLAIFTLDSEADRLLRERGLTEDDVLAQLTRVGKKPEEADDFVAQSMARARQLADDCVHVETDALHLLVALTRMGKSSAGALLERLAAPIGALRNQGLARLTAHGRKQAVRPNSLPRGAMPPQPPESRHGSAQNPAPRGPAHPNAIPPPLFPKPSRAPFGSLAPQPSPSHGPRVAVSESPQPQPSALPPFGSPSGFPQRSMPARPPPPSRIEPGYEAFTRDSQAGNGSQPGFPKSLGRQSSGPRSAVSQAPSKYALDPQKYPWLATHARNLSELAISGALDAAIGRESEVDEVLDILGKRRANNPVLVGEPGVGKTAIVEGLALRLAELALQGRLPDQEGKGERILVELDVGGLVAGTALRGSFSERLLGIKDDVKRAEGRIIVFIDELHMLIGAGSTGEGPQDAANELKAALARGEFPCIGATTHDEFRKHIQGDPALERRFVPVLVREPSVKQALRILEGAAPRYQAHHGVRFSPDALEAACRMTARYVRDRFLPDKAFAAIDLAGSRARREGKFEVDHDDVARAVARMAGLPEERLLQPDGERFLTLERRLSERIVGHERALSSLARVLRRNCAGFAGQRPLASLLFAGPSGVGKTETAKVLAEELFAAPDGKSARNAALVRLDLSEFSEPHSVSRLVGAAPGYVGYGEGGLLTEPVRRNPACVVLLDEAEKAHPAVLQLLLQVLDEGQLTDGRGRRVDFTAAVIVLTSNAGASAFGGGGRPAGFASQGSKDAPEIVSNEHDPLALTQPPEPSEHPQSARALEQARGAFAPELWSRFDERLIFAPLSREQVSRVAQLLLTESSRRLWDERRIAFRTGPGLVDALVQSGGFLPALGARPMRQAIERLVESPLADEILAGRVKSGDKLLALAGTRGIEFRREQP